jgi:hypothetical protein
MKRKLGLRAVTFLMVLAGLLAAKGDSQAGCQLPGCDQCYQGGCVITVYDANCYCWENAQGCVSWSHCTYTY